MTLLRPPRSAVFALALTLSLGGAALAQIDPRAEELLNGIGEGFAQTPQLEAHETIDTMDLTFCFTFYEAGEAQPEMCTRMVMDRTNRRMMQELHMTFEDEDGSEEHVTKTVYKDGQLTMRNSLLGEAFELPEAEVATLEATFETVFDQIADAEKMFPEEFGSATYDGEVNYGGVLVGEQVTTAVPVFTPMSTPMSGGASTQDVTMRLVFDEEGQLIGNVTETPEGEAVMIYNDPTDEVPFSRFFNLTSYLTDGNEAIITNKSRMTRFVINQPLDKALFELE